MDTEVSSVENVIRYSYKELRIATNDFSISNKIGEGGFGSVYKVLSAESKQGLREFLTEIMVISDVEHENLLSCMVVVPKKTIE
ncbi:unnamed protein product, partial [Ilex paraguariensis]